MKRNEIRGTEIHSRMYHLSASQSTSKEERNHEYFKTSDTVDKGIH